MCRTHTSLWHFSRLWLQAEQSCWKKLLCKYLSHWVAYVHHSWNQWEWRKTGRFGFEWVGGIMTGKLLRWWHQSSLTQAEETGACLSPWGWLWHHRSVVQPHSGIPSALITCWGDKVPPRAQTLFTFLNSFNLLVGLQVTFLRKCIPPSPKRPVLSRGTFSPTRLAVSNMQCEMV